MMPEAEDGVVVVVAVVVAVAVGTSGFFGTGLSVNICMAIHMTSISDAVVMTRDIELPPCCWGSRGGRNPPGELLMKWSLRSAAAHDGKPGS